MYLRFVQCILSIHVINYVTSTIIFTSDEEYIFKDLKGDVAYTDGVIIIHCKDHTSITEAIPPLTEYSGIAIEHVIIRDCRPSRTSVKEELESLNLNTDGIEEMSLIIQEKTSLAPGNYTTGLNIKKLLVLSRSLTDIFRNATGFFDPLNNLTTLVLYDVLLPKITDNIKLKYLELHNQASVENWGRCEHLEKLHLINMKRKYPIPLWPKSCTKLTELYIADTPSKVEDVLANMTDAAPFLKNLTLFSNLLYLMPNGFLQKAQGLQHLDLSKNNLYDKAFNDFPEMKNIITFDISNNLVTGTFLTAVVPRLPALKRIYMNNNREFSYCASREDSGLNEGIEYLSQSDVEEITLKSNYFYVKCFEGVHFKNLQYLDLDSTATLQFQLLDLPTTDADNLKIKFLRDRAVLHYFIDIYFTETDYEELRRRNDSLKNGTHHNHLTVLSTYIDCDCKHGWLAKGLRDFPNLIAMPDLRCNTADGISILEENPNKMECNMSSDADTHYKCVFRQVWGAQEIDAQCKSGIVPWKANLRSLDVSRTGLTSFFSELPPSVKFIDYSNNLLWTANQTAVDAMFENGRRVSLANNGIICDCDNRVLLDGIQEHRDQVVDYKELTCIGTGQSISSVSTSELCQTNLKTILATLGTLVGLILILALYLRRCRKEIAIFLYSRGWCLSCLKKEEFDDKPYDAFISYAHGDDTYVKEVLVPGLEKCPEKFYLCIHYRDWLVGGWIPAQIMHSVTHSKRTIIVLSKNFVESSWSALEFRYALANMTVDDISRVLILILDDVLDSNLTPEIQGYLDYNTYLRCDDPWFWEKLRYAMPHRTKNAQDLPRKPPKLNLEEEQNSQDIINMVMLMESNTPLSDFNAQ